MSDTNTLVPAEQLEGENIVMKLSGTFPETEQKEIARNMFLAMNMKTMTVKGEDGKNEKKTFNAYQALSYVMACRELGLNPVLNHVIMLEDQFYITLQGHLQNAHQTGQLVELTTELISNDTVNVKKTEWQENEKGKRFPKTVNAEVKQFRYRCTVVKFLNGRECKFVAEGVADETNVVGGDKATELKIEQMAEARAMRRCLARSFPVGLGNYEDALDAYEIGLRMSAVEQKLESANSSGIAEKLLSAKKPKATKAAEEPAPAPAPEPNTAVNSVQEISAETLSQVAHEEPKKEEAQTEIPAPAPVVAEPVEPVTEATVEEVFGEPEKPLAPGLDQIKRISEPVEEDEEAKDRAAFQSLREEFAKVIDEDTKFKSANGGNADPKISLRKAEITQKIVDLRRSFSTKYGKDISGS